MHGRSENVLDLMGAVQRWRKAAPAACRAARAASVAARGRRSFECEASQIGKVRPGTGSCEGDNLPNVVETQLHCSGFTHLRIASTFVHLRSDAEGVAGGVEENSPPRVRLLRCFCCPTFDCMSDGFVEAHSRIEIEVHDGRRRPCRRDVVCHSLRNHVQTRVRANPRARRVLPQQVSAQKRKVEASEGYRFGAVDGYPCYVEVWTRHVTRIRWPPA